MELSEEIATISRGKDAGAGDLTPRSPGVNRLSSATPHNYYPGSAFHNGLNPCPMPLTNELLECLLLSLVEDVLWIDVGHAEGREVWRIFLRTLCGQMEMRYTSEHCWKRRNN
jgi:hypothetical protein